ncbi:NADPH-dependent FMN reductase [Actibacterium pelagium]|uniref:NAD(P)H-dependent FMN reductase n=1 Tax=Actibacterium pelagium TaxID=2029103 RepID=A0A917AG82_9RHOB|nr:NAD(P)H-dependent oxidoreductase [Actibacterium pelagium]GGE49608.1 NAD(P)H-dependent FMN reductase [Actibacterium pelagium]
MSQTTLLGISGSLRGASINSLLVREAARVFEPDSFVQANLRLPLFDGDLEKEGIPAEVQLLADQITAADAVVISGPEYNKSLSGVLKNALDWVSRTKGRPFRDKPVAIMSATSGTSGGLMTQAALRLALYSFRPRLLQGPAVLVGGGAKAFDDQGHLTGTREAEALAELMADLKREITR